VRNAVRAVVFSGMAAGALWLAARRACGDVTAPSFRHSVIPLFLMALAVVDQSLVARRYVRGIDLEPFYRENAVVKALK
jgi:hypothetical protein